jgi:acyl-CoA thioester hydrolase
MNYLYEHKLRVRYAETDKMGYVYYGNYATYFEVARVEALRSLGLNYKSMEDSGVMLPVLEYSIKFYKPAFYDDELLIKLTMNEITGSRIYFEFETFCKDVKLNVANVTLVFVNMLSNSPCKPPDYFMQKLQDYKLK